MSPARSSTFRCFEIAGWLMRKGFASSITPASPPARRARIARRVGSASAAKVWSRRLAVTRIKPYGYIRVTANRSEEHTSELQSHSDLVCRLLLEKKKQHDNQDLW